MEECPICQNPTAEQYREEMAYHWNRCGIIAAGGDCMHFEADVELCECF
jgi:hypothetical protein